MPDPKTALITGASSGIGASLARELAARKYDCVLTARRTDRLEALAKELHEAHGVRTFVVTSDLGVAGGADKLIEGAAGLGLPIDVLVNNAGFGLHGNFVDLPLDRVQQMIELNLVAVTTLTHHYAKEMVGRKAGRILQVSSLGAFQASPLYAVYSATKAYLLSFSEALNYELRATGVNVTTLCPGLTATDFHAVADHLKPKWLGAITMTPGEVARLGVRGLFRGKAVVTPGFVNWLSAQMTRFVPRSLGVLLADLSMRGEA
jgi:uncharacterized protein